MIKGPARRLEGTARALKIEDGLVERTVDAIRKAAGTGKIGDGKIFVTSVEQAVRIRTGESGADAL